jgi:hypothetical protein
MPALHPVKKNYRKVHVTILYWEADELRDVVRSWSKRLWCSAHSRKTGPEDIRRFPFLISL